MKKIRILGVLVALLAAAVLAVGIYANNAKDGDGSFAEKLAGARNMVTALDDAAKAQRNSDAVEKRLGTAGDKIAASQETAAQAITDMNALDEALATGVTGDDELDMLLASLAEMDADAAGVDSLQALTDQKILALYQDCVSDAFDGVADAEEAIIGVRDGVIKVCDLSGVDAPEMEEVTLTEEPACASIEECFTAAAALETRAVELADFTDKLPGWYEAGAEASRIANARSLTFGQRMALLLADNYIGMVFTAALLLLAALVMIFLADAFRRQWVKNPVFSVGMALIAMLIFQTYALGFHFDGFAQWGKYWFDNTFNVLRANTSVGMVALGMTLVIITGGIDLAVGSTLAGVGTVLMTMIDTGDHGFLVKFGITGVPAFAIGIAVALVFGVAIGAVIGLLITKGHIPPFIVTLGVMSVVRSVAQYFTKSYTPTVPKTFEAISNTIVFGQRPMTIIYWVVLIVIFYFVMRNTAFGRHVYAVGSNERTTRLSGINTDRVKLKVYMISGLMVAIAAVTQLSRLGGMDVASAGNGYEMDAIAAAVVGGTSMSGGKGSIAGTVMGVLIIGIMNNLLILLGVDSFLTEAFKGAIVVVSVLMQRKEKLS